MTVEKIPTEITMFTFIQWEAELSDPNSVSLGRAAKRSQVGYR